MLNYQKLAEENPTEYGRMINSLGQEIIFVEHPYKGDTVPVICICHALKMASYSTFYELDDMLADHKEYEPSFQEGSFLIGQFIED
jgi:hypothetical protein